MGLLIASLSICLLNKQIIQSKMFQIQSKLFNYFLMLIGCMLISCKDNNNSKFKNSNTEEIENLYFSKVDFNDLKKSQPNSDNFSKSFTLNKDKFLSIEFRFTKH